MQVKDLLKHLESLDPELELVCYSEDEELVDTNNGFRLMEIEDISVTDARTHRDGMRNPTLTFGKGELSKKIALAHVTCNF